MFFLPIQYFDCKNKVKHILSTSFFNLLHKKMRKIIFKVENSFKEPKHLENNVFTVYMPKRVKLEKGEAVIIQIKFAVSVPQDIIYTIMSLPLF